MIGDLLRKLEAHPTFASLLEQIRDGRGSVLLSGLSGSSKSLLAAVLHVKLKRPLILITPNNQEAERAAKDFRFFISRLQSGFAEPLFFPSLDVDPYRGLSPHPTVAQQRALALWLMTQQQAEFVALPMRALMWRLPKAEEIASEGQVIRRGDWLEPEQLLAKLSATGYTPEDPVTEEGEFSRRGGIVDVFPPTSDFPVRVEFFGDEIASLRTYDPETQRSVEEIESAAITPLRETVFNTERLLLWADGAEEQWRASPYFSRLEYQLVQARKGEVFAGAEFYLPILYPLGASFFDYVRDGIFLLDEPEILWADANQFGAQMADRYAEVGGEDAPVLAPEHFLWEAAQLEPLLSQQTTVKLRELGILECPAGIGELQLSAQPVRKYQGLIREFISDISRSYESGETLVLLSSSLGRAERLQELLLESNLPTRLSNPIQQFGPDGDPEDSLDTETEVAGRIPLTLGVGDISSGFRLPEISWTLLGSTEIFGDNELQLHRRTKHRISRGTAFFSDFRDLKVGDYVVHVDHGIGQFRGLFQIGVGDQVRDFVLLHYKNEAKLYLPVERLDLIEKYSSVGGAKPGLDTLGGVSWERTKARIKKSMRDMAEELLRLYAQRNVVQGITYSPDSPWQKEFEEAFEFQETPDQVTSLNDVKRDMESPRPMDRLLCGDVGYGKTEIAIRAAFKAVMDGRQVSVLAPTTILVFQHHNTFKDRFKAFPVRIEMLSRFRSAKEQKQVIADAELGRVDIIIGTHRLLSKDVQFKDLGLVIIDEEQRFGVSHKEKLKHLRTQVDVLTMTATPIPRTLHMSLMGIRDMSVIETPPKDRLSIQTSVVKFNAGVIKAAIEMELARNGQVYLVHNRVESIYSMASLIQRLCPQARVAVGHGQMSERQLEEVMLRFVRHETDVLVSTTIIENGLDIPLVNTIIINRADRCGLSQLYQLRGRVGRSNRRAYAYLLIPSEDTLSSVARRRLAAVKEFSDLGAGFRIAALDLEIRGAGNLLGGEQHGHINAIGFDLYCQLLERTVRELKGEEAIEESQASINLTMDIRIPEDYVADTSQRLRLYKRISSSKSDEQLEGLRAEIVDRYGPFPRQLDRLFAYAGLRLLASRIGIESIDRKDSRIHVKFSASSLVDPQRLLELIRSQRGLSFSPGGMLTLEKVAGTDASIVAMVRNLLQNVL